MLFQRGEPTLQQPLNRQPWNSEPQCWDLRDGILMQMWYFIGYAPDLPTHPQPTRHQKPGHSCDQSAGWWCMMLITCKGKGCMCVGCTPSSSDTHSFPVFNALAHQHLPESEPAPASLWAAQLPVRLSWQMCRYRRGKQCWETRLIDHLYQKLFPSTAVIWFIWRGTLQSI